MVRFLLIIAAVLALSLPGPPTGAEAADRSRPEQNPERVQQQVVRLANAERAARGLNPLREQAALREAANWLARDMAIRDYFNHTDSQGRDMGRRLLAFGYSNAQVMAENIGKGAETPEAVVQGWLDSPPHRRNLLHPDVREIGVGYFPPSGDREPYWVLDLGVRFGRNDR
jgi:uncharacterized protein YkwD